MADSPDAVRSARSNGGRNGQRIEVLDFHPDLGADIDPAEAERARRLITCPLVEISPGPWSADSLRDHAHHGEVFASLVVEGLLVRQVTLGRHVSTSLYGPRDLIGIDELSATSPPVASDFVALTPVKLAVLDDRFVACTQRWPRLMTRLTGSIAEQVGRGCVRQAISQLPRAEQRLLALFWLLADRWGRVGPAGVTVEVSLTHEALGQLVGARRPTVSLALAELAAAGHVTRQPEGGWLLSQSSLALLRG